eukprot:768379-Hanusia_phi.AAC.2
MGRIVYSSLYHCPQVLMLECWNSLNLLLFSEDRPSVLYLCCGQAGATKRREVDQKTDISLPLQHPFAKGLSVTTIQRADGDYVCVHSLCTFINGGEATSLVVRVLYAEAISNFVECIPESVVKVCKLHQCLKALVQALAKTLQTMEGKDEKIVQPDRQDISIFYQRARALNSIWNSPAERVDTLSSSDAKDNVHRRASSEISSGFDHNLLPADTSEDEEICFLDSSSVGSDHHSEIPLEMASPEDLKFCTGYRGSPWASNRFQMILKSPQGHQCNEVECVRISHRLVVLADSFLDFISDDVESCRNRFMRMIRASPALESIIVEGKRVEVIAAEKLHDALKSVVEGIWPTFAGFKRVMELNDLWNRCAGGVEACDDALEVSEDLRDEASDIDHLLLGDGCLLEPDNSCSADEESSSVSELSIEESDEAFTCMTSESEQMNASSKISDEADSEDAQGNAGTYVFDSKLRATGLLHAAGDSSAVGVWRRVDRLEQRAEEHNVRIDELERRVRGQKRDTGQQETSAAQTHSKPSSQQGVQQERLKRRRRSTRFRFTSMSARKRASQRRAADINQNLNRQDKTDASTPQISRGPGQGEYSRTKEVVSSESSSQRLQPPISTCSSQILGQRQDSDTLVPEGSRFSWTSMIEAERQQNAVRSVVLSV